ncbi:hypothetical protein [Parvularcula sp. IMCC14364]|uniref:hypothetical protein n=1 Tax=Parvularcula sp. IMCC14364 TaxID=3067902 RepID=UPI002740EAFB|nr:hypothetical protein [Parvularcula sp. IMCC14364]
MTDSKLKLSLFAIRFTLFLFFSVWAIEKFIKPETTVAIWKAFYLADTLPLQASYIIGIIQSIAVLCLLFGVARFWSYGFFLLIHGVGTVLTYERLLDPYTGSNHLFAAAIPVFGALVALFLLRDEDTLFTIGNRK